MQKVLKNMVTCYIVTGIGSKKFPIHILVVHGSLTVRNPPEVKMETIKSWFQHEGQVEGLVWHCANGTLFKVNLLELRLNIFYR
jgi:hypothetical protein